MSVVPPLILNEPEEAKRHPFGGASKAPLPYTGLCSKPLPYKTSLVSPTGRKGKECLSHSLDTAPIFSQSPAILPRDKRIG